MRVGSECYKTRKRAEATTQTENGASLVAPKRARERNPENQNICGFFQFSTFPTGRVDATSAMTLKKKEGRENAAQAVFVRHG